MDSDHRHRPLSSDSPAMRALKQEHNDTQDRLNAAAKEHQSAVDETTRLETKLEMLGKYRDLLDVQLKAEVERAAGGKSSPFILIPDEVLSIIFRFLRARDVYYGAALVCQRWRAVAAMPTVRKFFESEIRWRKYSHHQLEPTILEGHTDWVRAVTVSPVHDIIFTASRDNSIRSWSSRGEHIRTLHGHDGAVVSLAMAPDGRLFSGSWDHSIRGWEARSGKHLMTLHGHTGSVFRLRFSPGGTLFSGSEDSTVRAWHVNREGSDDSRLMHVYSGHTRMVRALAFSEDHVYSGSWDCSIRRWRAVSATADGGDALDTVVTRSPILCLVFHTSRRELFSGSVDGAIRVWSESVEPLRIFELGKGAVDVLVLSRDNVLFSSCDDGSIKGWTPASGELTYTFRGHTDAVVDLAISPRTNELVSASWDRTARKW